MISGYPDGLNEDERKAVEQAIEIIKSQPNGDAKYKVIELVYIRRTHTLEGAAQRVHYSYDSVKKWHAEFIRLIGKCFSCKELR